MALAVDSFNFANLAADSAGLSVSVTALLKSVMWLVIGLCVVLPWAVIGFAGYRIVRKAVAPVKPPVAPSSSSAAPPATPA